MKRKTVKTKKSNIMRVVILIIAIAMLLGCLLMPLTQMMQ